MNGETNNEILIRRMNRYNMKTGARVGDWIRENDGRMTRATHDWNRGVETADTIQHGGNENSSFYLGDYGLSYSGGLDTGIKKADLKLTDELKQGAIWFFRNDYARAGNGITFKVDFRVYEMVL